jgi:hypothetical protein
MLNAYLSNQGQGAEQDQMGQMMQFLLANGDVYRPWRNADANLLQQSYNDPLAIFNGSGYQALDKRLQDTMMARDAASGNLFNAPERLAQREAGFMDYNQNLQKNLLQSSGASANPNQAISSIGAMAPQYSALANNSSILGAGLAGITGAGTTGGATGLTGLLGGVLGGIDWGSIFS